jgi:hypothetical protein
MPTIEEPSIAKEEQVQPLASHQYHAEANVLSGKLDRPIEQKIEPQAQVALKSLRGTHLNRFVEDVSIEGLISFKTGHTRVSGSRSKKHKGWVTLSASIMEDLNVFEVITADRVVAQVSTEHPLGPDPQYPDHVPRVTFLGTQFTNLQVSGFPLKLTLDLGICGDRPEHDIPYVKDSRFLSAIRKQVESIREAPDLPKTLKEKYDKRRGEIDTLMRNGNRDLKDNVNEIKIQCSLVKSIDISEIPIPGIQAFGNVLVIPEFGVVTLAEVEVGTERADLTHDPRDRAIEKDGSGYTRDPMSNYFYLTMLEMDLGCIGDGTVKAAFVTANGHTRP